MEISDYIPNYPELIDPEFNNKIYHKKEFYDLKYDDQTSKPTNDLWSHQKLIQRFVSPYTNYNRQLLFHTPGTGKTCASTAVAEMNKLDPLLRKPILIIVPNDTLVAQWKKQIATVCTQNSYLPENYNKLTFAEKTTRINKLLKPVYYITTIEKMRRHIDKFKGDAGDRILRNKYSNALIIIDEVHNLRIQTTNVSKENKELSKSRYESFFRFLHLLDNSKILLLTGTPMFDRMVELPGLMNLILPLDKQFPTGKQFTTKYLKNGEIVNEQELMSQLVGYVSFIRESGSFPTRIDVGDTNWTKFLKLVSLKMSPEQTKGYIKALAIDKQKTDENSIGLWRNSRQAATFVYDGQWGADAVKTLVSKGAKKTITLENKKMSIQYSTINSNYVQELKDNLKKYSSKYDYIVNKIQSNPKKPYFIFSPLVSGTGGAIFFGLILQLFGFARAIGNETEKALRYAIITGEEKSSIQRRVLIDMFNSPENRNGEMIQVMIGSKTISEGTNFTNVREEIILSPYWNNSSTEQAIGRGIRANSLLHVSDNERQVNVSQMAVYDPKIPVDDNVDIHMYKMSEEKDIEIKSAERVLKQVAWDCPLNYENNVRFNDIDDSRNCDYQKCNYVCYKTTPDKIAPKWSYTLPEDELDQSTFLIYYSEPAILDVVEKLRGLFRKFSYVDINTVETIFKNQNYKLLIMAIEYIIQNNVIIKDKWGVSHFLRKDENILFLSSVLNDTNSLNYWYNKHIYVNEKNSLSEIIDDEIIQKDIDKVSEICSNPDVIKDMNLETKTTILETLLRLNQQYVFNGDQKKVFEQLMKEFKENVFEIEKTMVHNMGKIKARVDYIDFITGEGGVIKCLESGGRWVPCNKRIEDIFTKQTKNQLNTEVESIVNNKYQMYGIITSDDKFQIVDKTKEKVDKDKTDLRVVYTGRVCKTWKKIDLLRLYLRGKVKVDTSGSQKSKKELEKAFPEDKNRSLEELKIMDVLSKKSLAALCEELKNWFVNNKLVIVQSV